MGAKKGDVAWTMWTKTTRFHGLDDMVECDADPSKDPEVILAARIAFAEEIIARLLGPYLYPASIDETIRRLAREVPK